MFLSLSLVLFSMFIQILFKDRVSISSWCWFIS